MKTRRIAAAVLLTILPATISLPAWSQADDPVTTQARARFKEGVDAFDKGRYEEARLAFLQAYTLKKHPAVLLNLAQSSAKSNHPLEAAKYFQQFLKEASTASPQQRKDAETGLAEVRQKLGRIDVVAPAGTEISLDDQGKIGTAPMEPVDVEPGSHTVRSPTQSTTVTAVAGQKVEARLGQPAAAAAPAPAPIQAAPAPAPSPDEPSPTQAPPPPDEVRVKRTNLLSPPETMVPVYVGLGAAGVGLAGAIIFYAFKVDAQDKADTVAEEIRAYARSQNQPTRDACGNSALTTNTALRNACQTLLDNNGKVDTNAAIANISGAVAGAGALLAIGWYLLGPKRDDAKPQTAIVPRRPVVTPWASWNTSGISIAGQF